MDVKNFGVTCQELVSALLRFCRAGHLSRTRGLIVQAQILKSFSNSKNISEVLYTVS
jgi:hypothetical protein